MNTTHSFSRKAVTIILLTLLLLSTFPLHAVSQLSVPVDHRVYTVLQSAELRGLIPRLPSVRPYSETFILNRLQMIETSALSDGEREELLYLIEEFSGDLQTTEKVGDLFQAGSYAAYSESHDVSVEVGAEAQMETTVLLNDLSHKDFRNVVRPYIRSDIKDILSFSMNVGLRFDRLDNTPFLDNDFSIPAEGFYMDYLDGGNKSDEIPMEQFYEGYDFHPEIATLPLGRPPRYPLGFSEPRLGCRDRQPHAFLTGSCF